MKKKTLKLINYYKTLLEQDTEQDSRSSKPDPTEPNNMEGNNDSDSEPEEDDTPLPLTSEGEKYLIDLLVKAFAHTPDDNELKIIDSINQEYRNENPKEIADAIQRLLDGGNEEFMSILDDI